MDFNQLDSEIDDARGDVSSLKKEIESLEEEHRSLLEQVRLLENKIPNIENSEVEIRKNMDKDIPHDTGIPLIVQHNHFDESISKYFNHTQEENPEKDGRQKKRMKLDEIAKDMLKRSETITELKENILYENIYRFGGITAFSLNKFLFEEGDEVLGIRFDIYSHFHDQFLTPHYVILRKISHIGKDQQITSKWSIYRHTLPVYVPLNEYTEDLISGDESQALVNFTNNIRNFLVQIQYKHDKFDSLSKLKFENFGINGNRKSIINKIDKDLQCQRVRIFFVSRKSIFRKNHELEIICSNDLIETAKLKYLDSKGDHKNSVIICESLLRNSHFKDLIKTFRQVIDHLIKHEII